MNNNNAKNAIFVFIAITILLPFAYFPISFGPIYAQTEPGSAISGSPCIAYDAEERQ